MLSFILVITLNSNEKKFDKPFSMFSFARQGKIVKNTKLLNYDAIPVHFQEH
jgi:hypothetical protein